MFLNEFNNSNEELNTSDVAKLLQQQTTTHKPHPAMICKQIFRQFKNNRPTSKNQKHQQQQEECSNIVDDISSQDVKLTFANQPAIRLSQSSANIEEIEEETSTTTKTFEQKFNKKHQTCCCRLETLPRQQQQQQQQQQLKSTSLRNFTANENLNAVMRDLLKSIEDGDDDDEDDDDGWKRRRRMKAKMNRLLRSRVCLFAVYAFLVLTLLTSFVGMVLIGGLVVEPFIHGLSFNPSVCRTLEVKVTRQQNICNCASNCKNYCLNVKVHVFDSSSSSSSSPMATTITSSSSIVSSSLSSSSSFSANIYEDEGALNNQCSSYPRCTREGTEAAAAGGSYSFEKIVGKPGQLFPCWSNKMAGDRKAEVILRKRFRVDHVVHGMGWSLVTFFAAATLLILVLRRKDCNVRCRHVTLVP